MSYVRELWRKRLHEKLQSDKRKLDKRSLNGRNDAGGTISNPISTATALVRLTRPPVTTTSGGTKYTSVLFVRSALKSDAICCSARAVRRRRALDVGASCERSSSVNKKGKAR